MKSIISVFVRKDITTEEKGLFFKELKITGVVLGLSLLFLALFYLLGSFNVDSSGERYFEGTYKDYIFIALTTIFLLVFIAFRVFFTIKRHKLEKRK